MRPGWCWPPRRSPNRPEGISLTVNGAVQKGALYRTYREGTLDAGPVTIANTGSAAVQMVVGVAGNPIGFEPALSRGFKVDRAYYKLDGTKLESAQGLMPVRQNERFVTVLTVTEENARAGRLLLVDRLPAGFEIDNRTSSTVGRLRISTG
jgi:uncharacterized protein YfaS (alpha-2-macroglobulin family)